MQDSNTSPVERDVAGSPEELLWAGFDSADVYWLLLAESGHSLPHTRTYQIHVDGRDRSQTETIFSAAGWARPRIVRSESTASHDQWVHVREGSMVRVDVHFSLAFQAPGGEWRYTGEEDVLATRTQRSDGVWVAGDDHALPLVAFLRSTSQGPAVDQAFAEQCAGRYAGRDKVDLARLIELGWEASRVSLPAALEGRLSWFEGDAVATGYGRRPTMTVGLIGPDGSGKTTLCELVETTLEGWVVRAYLGQKNYVLPGVELAEHRGGSVFTKLFRYLAYPLDLSVRWKRQSSRARGKILLVDRLPMFPFTGDSGRLMPAIYNCALPKFDLLVRLGGDDRAIYDRKPEGDFATFEKNAQKARDVNIEQLGDVCVELDATRPLDEVLDALLASVFATAKFRTSFLTLTMLS